MPSILNNIRAWRRARRFRRAVQRANSLAATFHCRYYVIAFNGRFRVIPKQQVKQLIRQRRFKPGTSIADIERRALYISLPNG